jgi:hypothetical protein
MKIQDKFHKNISAILEEQNRLFQDILKSKRHLEKLDKSLHKSIWFSGLWVGMLIVQLWNLFFGRLGFPFILLQLDLMLLMFIYFVKGGWLNGYKY